MRRFFTGLLLVLLLGRTAGAIEATPELLRTIEKLREAAAWNDRQFFSLVLKQSLGPQLEELDRKLGVRSKLQADQIQLQHVLGGLLTAWTVLALDDALAGDEAAWATVRQLGGQMKQWLMDYDAALAREWQRALTAAPAVDDPGERAALFAVVRPKLLAIVKVAFDPVAAKARDRAREAAVQPLTPSTELQIKPVK